MTATFEGGKVTARKIKGEVHTGPTFLGADAATIARALDRMPGFKGGAVTVSGVIEGNVYTHLHIVVSDPQAAQAAFLKELRALSDRLAEVRSDPGAPVEAKAAAQAVEQATTEAEKPKPLAKVVGNRLKEAVDFLTDLNKGIDTSKTIAKSGTEIAQRVAQALPQAIALYELAKVLFKIG